MKSNSPSNKGETQTSHTPEQQVVPTQAPPAKFTPKAQHVFSYFLYFVLPQLSVFVAVILMALCVKLKSKGIAGFLVIAQFVQQFVGKSKIYQDLYDWLEPHKYFRGYNVHYETPLETEKILLPFHPHSIYTMAIHFNMYRKDEELSKAYYCSSRMALQIPLAGTFYRLQGLVGANPEQFKQLMREKKRICFVPGGFEEASLTSDKNYNLYLEHKGFIKYAMQFDYKIRPVFVFNETKAFPTIDKFYQLRLFLNKVKMGGALFYWKTLPFFADSQISIEVVVAKPFEAKQIANPTDEEIENEHRRYFDYVNQVYHKFKKVYDPEGKDLTFYKNGQFSSIPPPDILPKL